MSIQLNGQTIAGASTGIVSVTLAQYNNLKNNNQLNPNIAYYVTDDYSGGDVYTKAQMDSMLANIHQTSPTCTETNGITAGTYFYLDGTLVRAKTAIANGATFTKNTNYETVTAGALNYNKDTGWMALNVYLRYRKIGDVVYVEITSDSYTPSTSNWVRLGTLPSGYRPNVNVRVCLDNESNWWANVAVYSTGEVRVLGNFATCGQLSFAI